MRQLLDSKKQSTIHQQKQAIFEGHNITKAVCLVDEHICCSWERLKESHFDYKIKQFPKKNNNQHIFANINELMRYHLTQNAPYYLAKKKLLEQIGAAVFYLDSELNIFNKDGDQALLADLKKIGIKIGSSMREDLAGTNAAVLANRYPGPHWVIGEEHAAEVLTDYITLAFTSDVRYWGAKSSQLFFLPLSRFDSQTVAVLEYICQAELPNYDFVNNDELIIKNEIVHLNMRNNRTSMIVVDQRGIILDINKFLAELLQIEYSKTLGKSFTTMFPKLEFALSVLKNKQSLSAVEVSLVTPTSSKMDYLLDSVPIIKNGNCLGAVITLFDKRQVTKSLGNTRQTAKYTFADLVGLNPCFLSIKNRAIQAAAGNSSILLIGESGTGKELFAQAIHNASPRSGKPFIAMNCAAIPRDLISSELFGYAEGAFTGARKGGAAGKFELANGGTLFLDEIADMPLDMQAVLLRVLEESKITRLGNGKPFECDVRILAATNRNLLEYVEERTFRLDLYHRLNVIKLEIPPLRSRKDDLLILTDHFLQNHNRANAMTCFTPEAMDILRRYHWPGNIRELRNTVEYCLNMNETSSIFPKDLPDDILSSSSNCTLTTHIQSTDSRRLICSPEPPTGITFAQYERERIYALMLKHKGNKSKVADELGIARSTLYRKLKLY
jgi:transcriptional regulator with PAS, ATPase and Fis domain